MKRIIYFISMILFGFIFSFGQSTYHNLGAATDFNVYIIGNAELSSADIQGKVAVGRNGKFTGYSIGDQIPNSEGLENILVVSDSLWYNGGRVYSGNVVYGEFADVSDNLILDGEGEIVQGSTIDFTAVSLEIADISVQWKSLESTGSITMENTTLVLIGSNSGLNIFSLNGEDLNSATGLTIQTPEGSTALVNVSGSEINWNGDNDVLSTNQTNVVYNFYEADSINISGIAIKGSVLAPFSVVNFVSGQINGNLIAHDLYGEGQVNNSWFQGNVEYESSEVVSDCFVTMRSTLQGTSFYLNTPFYSHGSLWAGTILGTADNHSTSYYCIDISHNLRWNKPYSWDHELTGPISYITKNYYPYVAYTGTDGQLYLERKEAAAIQCAIWHFSDGFDPNNIHSYWSDIKQRALEIIEDANNQSMVPVATFSVSPASQVLQIGQTAMLTITVQNSIGEPIPNIWVQVSSTNGGDISELGMTDSNGKLIVAIPYDENFQIEHMELEISTEDGIVSPGTRYLYPNSQTLITNKELITCLSTTANVYWSEGALPGNDFDFYEYTISNSDLPAVPVKCVISDEDYVYFGTGSNGVYKFNRTNEEFSFIETDNLNISAIHKIGDNLFVGFSAGGFAKINSNNEVTYFNSSNSDFIGTNVTDFESIDDGTQLVISHDAGVSVMNIPNSTFVNFSPSNSQILPGLIYDLTTDEDDGIWAATDYGLSYLENILGEWVNFTTDNSQINGQYLRAVQYGNGKVFVGTFYNGLCAYEISTQTWTNYTPFISTQPVMNLSYADEKLFIANWSEGLYVFNGENFKQYSSVNQFNAPSIVEGFSFDGTDSWFATQSGLSRTINGISNSTGNAAIIIGDNSTYTGGSVSLACNLEPTGEIEFYSLSGSFQYNSNELSYEGFTVGALLSGCVVRMNEVSVGRIEYNIYSEEPITLSGKMFDLTFIVNEELASLGEGISAVYAMSFTAGFENHLNHEDLGIISWSSSGTGNAGPGDATLDGNIDLSDLLATVHHYTYGGRYTLEGDRFINGDVDISNEVEGNDACMILSRITNGCFPDGSIENIPTGDFAVQSINYNTEINEANVSLNLLNTENINNLTIVFEFDSNQVDYSAFSTIQVGSGNYVNASSLSSTEAVFNFNTLTFQNGNIDLGNIIFNYNAEKGDLYVSTRYSFNGIDFVAGPIITLNPTGIDENEIPTEYSLSQNYPNPFSAKGETSNPTTTIRYAIPFASKVSLKVYNILGQEVITLVNKQVNAGVYTVNLDATSFASGVYFYRLQSGNYTNVKKMILLK